MPATPARDLITRLHPRLHDSVASASDKVYLASPFVGPGTAAQLAAARAKSSAEWRLLTVVSARSAAYGSLSVPGLRRLAAAGVDLAHLHGLHAKLFLTDADGFAGSANLTWSGLGSGTHGNREMTVALDADQCAFAHTVYEGWWHEAVPITAAMLTACEKAARKIKVVIDPPDPVTGPDVAVANTLLEESLSVTTWAKAVYRDAAAADAANDTWVASPGDGRPQFAVGDLMLLYAKHAGTCSSVLEVTGPSRHDTAFVLAQGVSADAAVRWPWVTPARERLHVPSSRGVPLEALGISGGSLQPGHRRLPTGAFAAALAHLVG